MSSASAAIPQPGSAKAFLRVVMIEHSVFALPFAYIASLTAMYEGDKSLHWITLFLVTVAIVGLRTFAMAANRIIDREIDARNPRTAQRELVTGAMSVKDAWAGALIAAAAFLTAAALLNPLCLALAPVAVVPTVVCPYAKRFTNYPQASWAWPSRWARRCLALSRLNRAPVAAEPCRGNEPMDDQATPFVATLGPARNHSATRPRSTPPHPRTRCAG